jgi:probable DNA repair protein
MPDESLAISRNDLFARLAEGHAAGISVVTPNRRLARTLRAEFDVFQTNKGLSVWEDADMLPLDSFVERLYEDSLYADPQGGQPQLLSAAQEQALWESVLEKSELIAIAKTAERCMEAWKLAHRWRIEGAAFSTPGKVDRSDDAKAFAGWAAEYAKRCRKEGWIDAARLPALKFSSKTPKLLVGYGFAVVPPQSRDLISRFEFSFCSPDEKKSNSKKTPYPSSRHEIEAAAKWARERLEKGAKRIGVVVPDLDKRLRQVTRTFAQVLGVRRAFDVSLGEPLSAFPIVSSALSLLEIAFHEAPFETASRLIRSPFVGGAQAELGARARLDVRLRRRLGASVPLAKLIAETEGSLRFHFEKIFQVRKENESKTQAPFAWARVFTSILEAAGFPGERALDSAEFQARAKFNELLGEFSRLGVISNRLSSGESLKKIHDLCKSTLFQPETPEAPIQVLGMLESLGLEFDALWVSGMTEQAWPLRTSPNPFLPLGLQKQAGIPEATAERSLERAKQITAGWSAAAPEVVFSWPAHEEDRDLLPSPLLAQVPEGEVDLRVLLSFQDVLYRARRTETLHDEKAPPLKDKTVRGGTRVLADQAACPFRAFATWRLGAKEMEAPSEGPDAADRGRLLHALMAEIWRQLGSSSSLSKDLTPVIEKAAAAAVKQLEIGGKFAELEIERLSKLACEWLDVERRREPFEAVQIEHKIPIEASGLSLSGRIDRMDRLKDGSHVLIDYKSGRASTKDWEGDRPDDPQLPLYALASKDVGAVAFARLKTGDMGFAGVSRAKGVLPKVEADDSWNKKLKNWKTVTEKLADQFTAGDARVDPKIKKGLLTCRLCALQPLCRVHERFGALGDEGEGA